MDKAKHVTSVVEAIKNEVHTIDEWNEIFWAEGKFKVMDPDGFDRTDASLMFRKFTRAEFEKGAVHSTCQFGPNAFRRNMETASSPQFTTPGTNVEPAPTVLNDGPAIWDLVLEDMKNRDQLGAVRYGVRLQPFNGRRPLVDAYQEALDLVVYLRQAIYEEYGE